MHEPDSSMEGGRCSWLEGMKELLRGLRDRLLLRLQEAEEKPAILC